MNDSIRFTLTGDGPSDRVLLYPLSWILRRRLRARITTQPLWADLRPLRDKPKGLAQRIQAALELYPCDLLFVHRDAETATPADRIKEISEATAELGVTLPVVCVVPVRMTEAWLLFDERAVRLAAGNPNGRTPLPIPFPDPETIADPKRVLHEALRLASGLSGRRLKNFSASGAVHRVAEYIEDFSPLLALPAFKRLENDLARVLHDRGWD